MTSTGRQARKIFSIFLYIFFTLFLAVHLYRKVGFSPQTFSHALDKQAVIPQALPKTVIAIKNLATRNTLDVVNLSATIMNDPVLHQRTVEYIYPIRVGESRHVLAMESDASDAKCRVTDTLGGVILYECAQ